MSVDLMLSRFQAVFGDPPSSHRPIYLAEIKRCMGTYPPEVVAKAADIAIDTRVAWPRPAELRAIALKAAAILSRRVPEMDPVKRRTPDEIARVNQMTAEFRRAMQESERCSSDRQNTTPQTCSVNAGATVVPFRGSVR